MTIAHTETSIYGTSPRSSWLNPVGSLLDAISRWRAYNRTLAELELLSDRDLADIGLGADDVRSIARQAAGY